MRRAAVLAVALVALSGCDVWRAFFPAKIYETEPPELPADLAEPAILVFTKTNGFRHREAIPAGLERIRAIAERRGWSLFHTENGAVFNADQLARFAAVVWHNTSGDTLGPGQKRDFRAWMEGGGGFVGIHGAGGDPSYEWDWYVEELLRAQFTAHIMGPQFQPATLRIEDRDHPATRHLEETWTHTEEWYSFEASPRGRGVRVLASVDESTYVPVADFLWINRDLRMGDHPVIWSHCVGRGRALFSALGHRAEAYALPEYRGVLEGAIAWAAGLEGDACPD